MRHDKKVWTLLTLSAIILLVLTYQRRPRAGAKFSVMRHEVRDIEKFFGIPGGWGGSRAGSLSPYYIRSEPNVKVAIVLDVPPGEPFWLEEVWHLAPGTERKNEDRVEYIIHVRELRDLP